MFPIRFEIGLTLALSMPILPISDNFANRQDEQQKEDVKTPAHSKLQELLQARVEAAKSHVDVQLKVFQFGARTPGSSLGLDSIFDAQRLSLLAELEATNNKADRSKALETYLAAQKEHQRVNQHRYDNGAIASANLNSAKYYRLEAELWLEREKAGKNPVGSDDAGSPRCRELLQQRLRIAKAEITDRIELFKNGAFIDLFTPSQRLLLTELQASEKKADRLEALKAHLQRMRTIEEISQTAFEAGKYPSQALFESKYYRLDAEIRVEQLENKNQGTNRKLQVLMQARLEAGNADVEARTKIYETGRVPVTFFLDSSRRLLFAELEATDDKPKQSAALQAHLERMKKAEQVGLELFKKGACAITDPALSKCHRLEAEIWLEQFRVGGLRRDDISVP